jgi:hypothetical protein
VKYFTSPGPPDNRLSMQALCKAVLPKEGGKTPSGKPTSRAE